MDAGFTDFKSQGDLELEGGVQKLRRYVGDAISEVIDVDDLAGDCNFLHFRLRQFQKLGIVDFSSHFR